jgi:hypothetical protein
MSAVHIFLSAQGAFYVATGAWSILSRATFERVTGPKTDYWLVRMVGLLAVVIGATLLAAVREPTLPSPVWVLAIGSAAAFTAIDVHYAARKRISRVYLLDATAETLIVAGLIVGWWLSRPVA